MRLIQTHLPDLIIIEPKVFQDQRGWFMESYHEAKLQQAFSALNVPLPRPFVQENISCSQQGVLRGLHFQQEPHAQGKLVQVLSGSVWDVAVDIRVNSATYGQWVGILLSGENKKMLWIPEGFAHGFLALEDHTLFSYKVTDPYTPESECSIRWNDEVLAIKWPSLAVDFILSDKDKKALAFSELFNSGSTLR